MFDIGDGFGIGRLDFEDISFGGWMLGSGYEEGLGEGLR